MKMEMTGCYKTLAYKLQMPANQAEESIRQLLRCKKPYLLNTIHILYNQGQESWSSAIR
jgi:hypothetical protein